MIKNRERGPSDISSGGPEDPVESVGCKMRKKTGAEVIHRFIHCPPESPVHWTEHRKDVLAAQFKYSRRTQGGDGGRSEVL